MEGPMHDNVTTTNWTRELTLSDWSAESILDGVYSVRREAQPSLVLVCRVVYCIWRGPLRPSN